jgi:hypothetical protein
MDRKFHPPDFHMLLSAFLLPAARRGMRKRFLQFFSRKIQMYERRHLRLRSFSRNQINPGACHPHNGGRQSMKTSVRKEKPE